MNIKELIQIVDNQGLSEARPKVKPDGKGGYVNAETGQPFASVEQGGAAGASQEQPQAQAGTAPSAGSTMDPRLQQPVDAEPEQPKKTFAQKLGTVAANVGAIPGAFKGIKTAYQKGKADMATRVGGPVNQPAAAGGAAPQGQASGSQSEIDDLRQMINRIDARLAKHGLNQ
jgi:hypothetical protein